MGSKKSARGPRGPAGPPGPRGERGPAGPAGSSDRLELLGLVQSQIHEIYGELEIQMKRMGQLQMQLDDLRGKVRRLAESPAVLTGGRSARRRPVSNDVQNQQ